MAKKKTDKPTETNPDQLPKFTPPQAVEPSMDDHSKAVATVQDLLVGVSTADAEVKLIEQFIAMSNEGAQGLIKIYGLTESVRFLSKQSKRIKILMSGIVSEIHDYTLWKLVADAYGYEQEYQYWEDNGWTWAEVQSLANFGKHVKPMLEIAGIDPVDFFENTSPKAMAATQRTAQDMKRQLPEFKNTPRGEKPKVDDDTREALKTNLLMFRGIPDSEVKNITDIQKGKDPHEPVQVTVTHKIVNGKYIQFYFAYNCDPEQLEKLANHTAYEAYYYQGNRTNHHDLAKIAQDLQAQLDENNTVDGSIEPYSDDLGGLDFDDEDFKPLQAHAG